MDNREEQYRRERDKALMEIHRAARELLLVPWWRLLRRARAEGRLEAALARFGSVEGSWLNHWLGRKLWAQVTKGIEKGMGDTARDVTMRVGAPRKEEE